MKKRAITPRWVIRFSSKLQGSYILLCWSILPCQISDIINSFRVITQKPAILPYVLFLVTAAMLIGAQHHRTQFSN
jgi:hypothetical protein